MFSAKRKNPHSSLASPFNRQTFHLDHFQLSLIIACPSAIPREVLRAEAGCMCVLGLGSYDFDCTPKACRVHIPIQKVLLFFKSQSVGPPLLCWKAIKHPASNFHARSVFKCTLFLYLMYLCSLITSLENSFYWYTCTGFKLSLFVKESTCKGFRVGVIPY